MQNYAQAFGKNDIRGIYGKDVTEELFFNTGKAFVEYLKEISGKKPEKMWLTIAMDARLHSPILAKSLISGITQKGAHVVNLGLAPTPMGYYSEVVGIPKNITNGEDIISAAIITASHNPKEYNGLKLTYNHCTLDEKELTRLKELTINEFSITGEKKLNGEIKNYNIINDYIKDMKQRFDGKCTGVKVVVDSANATGGIVGPELYRILGCEVIELFSEPDGNFPNHHPNPSVEKTLDTLKETVIKNNADIGIAYDGDADRIGVVDNHGNYLTGDKLLLIYAQELIKKCKNEGIQPIIVSEVKCSQVLYDTIDELGGKSIMCKTGHGYIKDKMKETGAILAGEISGHTFFKDSYYGFDDSIYAGCRILEIISSHKKINPNFTIQDMLKPFDDVYSSSEVRYPCPNELKGEVLNKVKKCIENNKAIFGVKIKDIITLDGMRIVFDGGFALIRQSNTEPVFTLRFEAKTEKQCKYFEYIMITMLKSAIN